MIDIFRYTDIAEAGAAILNPLSFEKLLLLGELMELRPDLTMLDLACGKGEMLCQFAARHARSWRRDRHPRVVHRRGDATLPRSSMYPRPCASALTTPGGVTRDGTTS